MSGKKSSTWIIVIVLLAVTAAGVFLINATAKRKRQALQVLEASAALAEVVVSRLQLRFVLP